MKIQECVFDKIEDAYNEFKEEMLKKNPEEIFEKAYKIACIRRIYDILYDSYEHSPRTAELILEFKGNILEQVYDDWLKRDDSFSEEIEESINNVVVWSVNDNHYYNFALTIPNSVNCITLSEIMFSGISSNFCGFIYSVALTTVE